MDPDSFSSYLGASLAATLAQIDPTGQSTGKGRQGLPSRPSSRQDERKRALGVADSGSVSATAHE
jgi:hypothetical protein